MRASTQNRHGIESKPANLPKCKLFAEKMLEKSKSEEIPLYDLLITDEAHFYLSGHVNWQNYQFWAQENPKILHEEPLHGLKVQVWTGIAGY